MVGESKSGTHRPAATSGATTAGICGREITLFYLSKKAVKINTKAFVLQLLPSGGSGRAPAHSHREIFTGHRDTTVPMSRPSAIRPRPRRIRADGAAELPAGHARNAAPICELSYPLLPDGDGPADILTFQRWSGAGVFCREFHIRLAASGTSASSEVIST